MGDYVEFVFQETGTPDLIFVEVEDSAGKSIDYGTWAKRADGQLVLRVPRGDSDD